MTTFVLVRHASHDLLGVRLAGRMTGVRLSALGREEAEQIAARLAGESAAALATSPRERCLETAAPIARVLHLRPTLMDQLDEVEFGAWTGATFETLERDPAWRSFNEHRSTARPPGGESMVDVARRAMDALEALHRDHDGRKVVVVSHADVLRALVARVLGMDLDAMHRFVIDPASITVLQWWGDGTATLVSLNEVMRVPASATPRAGSAS